MHLLGEKCAIRCEDPSYFLRIEGRMTIQDEVKLIPGKRH